MNAAKTLDMDWVHGTCKIGQGEVCCRYLALGSNGFECGKLDAVLRETIDQRYQAGTMHAKGDNCGGHPLPEDSGDFDSAVAALNEVDPEYGTALNTLVDYDEPDED